MTRSEGLPATLAFSLLLAATSAAAGNVSVLSSRGDPGRTGANLRETLLTAANVNPDQFGLLFEYRLADDVGIQEVYAQPLVISHVGIPRRGVRNLLIVATSGNFVFAFDADGPTRNDAGVLWKRQLGAPPTIEQMLSGAGKCSFLACTNIRKHGPVGILSTPAVDAARGIVFLVARTVDAGGAIHHRLHAIDMRTGADRPGSPAEIVARVGTVVFEPRFQNQRVGLALAQRQVIVAWGSHEDAQPYHGWVMSYRYDGAQLTQTGVFLTTPTGDTHALCGLIDLNRCAHGGIWQAGRAPAVDGDGRVLLFVGNGKNDLLSGASNQNFGNSFVALHPTTLSVLDFFTPANHTLRVPGSGPVGFGINELDLDLGGSGPMLVPGSPFAVGGGKEGVMHVWRVGGLGGFSPTDASVVQKFFAGEVRTYTDWMGGDSTIGVVNHLRAGHIMGGPVFWPRPPTDGGALLFNWSEDTQLRAYSVNPSAAVPVGTTPVAFGGDVQLGHPGGILALSANRSERKSGIVWAATYDAQGDSEGALHALRPGILRAYAADTLATLWNSEQKPERDRLGTFAKFSPPTVANGRVYMATFSNRIAVYGLLQHRYSRPAAEAWAAASRSLMDEE